MLYGNLDPDALGDPSEPAESLAPSTMHRTSPLHSIPLTSAPFDSTIRLSTPLALPAPPQAAVFPPSLPKIEASPDSSPASSTSLLLELELPDAPEHKEVD